MKRRNLEVVSPNTTAPKAVTTNKITSKTFIKSIRDRAQAVALLDPLRLQLMDLALQPISAAEAAVRLDLPRQRVNYHVRALAKHGLLRRAGRRQKRNMTEQLYRSVARTFLLDPELLGPLAARLPDATSAVSLAELLRLTSSVQSELVQLLERAESQTESIASLTVEATFEFESADDRAAFGRALQDAVSDVVRRFTRPPASSPTGSCYRLVVGCYPRPQDLPKPQGGDHEFYR